VTIQGPTDDPTIGIRVRADQLQVLASGKVLSEDATSQSAYGEQGFRGVTVRQEMAESDMQDLADDYLAALKDPRQIVEFEVLGDRADAAMTAILGLDISDRVRFLNSRTNVDITGWVEHLSLHIGEVAKHTARIAIREVV